MKQDLTDVHAIAYETGETYQIQLADSPPDPNAYAKVIEPIDETRQLVLWVPEGTPGDVAQNLATHFVPQLRQ